MGLGTLYAAIAFVTLNLVVWVVQGTQVSLFTWGLVVSGILVSMWGIRVVHRLPQ